MGYDLWGRDWGREEAGIAWGETPVSKQRGQWLTRGPGESCGTSAQARRPAAGDAAGRTACKQGGALKAGTTSVHSVSLELRE